MADLSKIPEHAEVIGADGVHVGTVDHVDGNRLTLTGNRTLGFPSNIRPGTSGKLLVYQDGTGGRTLGTTAAGFVGVGGQKVVLQAADEGAVIDSFDQLRYKATNDKAKAELIDGKFGKATKFTFPRNR